MIIMVKDTKYPTSLSGCNLPNLFDIAGRAGISMFAGDVSCECRRHDEWREAPTGGRGGWRWRGRVKIINRVRCQSDNFPPLQLQG